MSGTENLRYLTPSSSYKGKPDSNKEEGKSGNPKPLNSWRSFLACRCSSPPSDCHASKTVRRISTICLISLITLLGNTALDLSQTLESWRHIEKALGNVSSCRGFLALSLFNLLVQEGDWQEGGGGDMVENISWPGDALENLAALCKESGDVAPGTIPRCRDDDNFGCQTYITLIRERVNGTQGAETVFLQLKRILGILEILQKLEKGDHQKMRSIPDWWDVAFLRLVLRIKGAMLRAQEMSLYPEDAQALWHQLSVVLTSSVFISESTQECWAEHPNFSTLATHHKGLHMFAPSLGFLSLPPPLMDELDILQRCLLQKSREKLQKKSKDIISLVSLKISLLVVTGLIYPAVLVSFKEMAEWIQNYARNLKERTEDLKRERQVAEDLLHQMLPKSVAKQLFLLLAPQLFPSHMGRGPLH